MGIGIPVTATDAQATSMLPIPVKAIPELTVPVPVTVILVQPPMVENQLGGSYINNMQVHDSTQYLHVQFWLGSTTKSKKPF